jgi:hypothetical protein
MCQMSLAAEGITFRACRDFSPDLHFVAGQHGMTTGAGPFRVRPLLPDGALPMGLAIDTDVWVIERNGDTFWLASSARNARDRIALAGATPGTGLFLIEHPA